MRGFTFIELVIYIGIVAFMLVLAGNFMWDIIQGGTINDCWREVQQNARFSMEEITRSLRAGEDPSVFSVEEGILYKNDIPLTSEQVRVSNFSITPISNSYQILLQVDYYNPSNRPEYYASVILNSAVTLLTGTTTSSSGCWGTGGSCDPACLYSNYGTLTDYYIDPGCSASCDPAGSFYVNPSGSCSTDGSGTCYKMENPTTQYTFCTRGAGCEQGCRGEPISCDRYDNQRDCESNGCTWEEKGECYGRCDCRRYPSDYCETCPLCELIGERCTGMCQCSELKNSVDCRSCPECRWLGTGEGRCTGSPTPCEDISDPRFCERHGCRWRDVKWYWNEENSVEGYMLFSQCQWYAQ